jgi:hypothetical protein
VKTKALKLGINNFHASNGRLSKFKRQWNLTILSVCGEEVAVDMVEEWKKNLPSLVAGYECKTFLTPMKLVPSSISFHVSYEGRTLP